MFKKSTVTKTLLITISLVMLTFFVKDWVDFAKCGAVQSCLDNTGSYQNYTKFLVSFLLTTLAFYYTSKFALSPRDGKFLRIAFVFSLIADFCFRILPMTSFELPVSTSVLGITFFMFFQSALIVRHTRTSENDSHFPKAFIAPFAFLVITAALYFMGAVPQLVFVVGTYGAFLITSLVMGCKVVPGNYYNQAQAYLVKIGMIVFFLGDVLVGLALATSDDHSLLETIATIANGLIWLAYVPAQLLLIKSCCEK